MTGRSRHDARLDAIIHDQALRDLGVLEPDEPTAVSHAVWMDTYRQRARGEFTPKEREQIRALLCLGPFSETGV